MEDDLPAETGQVGQRIPGYQKGHIQVEEDKHGGNAEGFLSVFIVDLHALEEFQQIVGKGGLEGLLHKGISQPVKGSHGEEHRQNQGNVEEPCPPEACGHVVPEHLPEGGISPAHG